MAESCARFVAVVVRHWEVTAPRMMDRIKETIKLYVLSCRATEIRIARRKAEVCKKRNGAYHSTA